MTIRRHEFKPRVTIDRKERTRDGIIKERELRAKGKTALKKHIEGKPRPRRDRATREVLIAAGLLKPRS